MNDTLAFAAMEVIKGHGLRIPQDVALIGYTDERHANYVEPKLSAISHQTYLMGETACRLLIEQIKGDKTIKQVVIPTHLQIRESSIKSNAINLLFVFCRTFRAKPFQYIVDAVKGKSFRNLYYRGRNILETKCLVASLTMKMSMKVVDFARATCTAYRIFKRACSVINAVYQVMGEEKGDGAEDRRFINRIQHIFQIEQRDGTACL